jgi:hypothetical protein
MPMTPRSLVRLGVVALAGALAGGAALLAQTDPPAPAETPVPAETPAALPVRVPEGDRIINLPSAEVARPRTLTVLFTHRFAGSVEQSDIHSLFSFDSGAEIGLGLAYAPIKNLEVSFLRSTNLEDYELDVKYRVFATGPLAVALRVGGDWRTERNLQDRNGVFGQAIFSVSVGRIHLTAVPTYVSLKSGANALLRPFYRNVFNVNGAVSIGVTRSINVQGEIQPRDGRVDSPGVGWIASIEKTVPRHRFAFTVGNQRGTTVDQYVAWTPQFFGQSPHRYYFGFNLVRSWGL